MQVIKQKIDSAVQKPAKHIYRLKSTYLIMLLLLACSGIYQWQHSKVNNLTKQLSGQNQQVVSLNGQIKSLNADAKNLNETIDTLHKTAQTTSAAKNATPVVQLPDYNDGNFILMRPNCGLLTHQNQTTFEWTPHKLATTYVVEIKFLGQQNYPNTNPTDQVVTYNDTASQPAKISLTKDIPFGDYTWRVTAKTKINGQEKILQSTSDCNYQTWAS